ncbi:MAG: 2-dehydropantoate 2-reductase [Deltaproteobacteria bacterium]|nr:MAG: 2-dehydropantoate 2-reductase [Deltaproteobacteria bacterium]
MRTLIVGIGALGGTIATRAVSAGMPVWLATRTGESARALRASGLRVSGVGGTAAAASVQAAVVADYRDQHFDLILLATKAHEALEIAPFLSTLLTPGGTLLCIQNGGVSQILSDRLGTLVLGGVSNLGATMIEPGVYEQRNAGHLLIGEIAGGLSERTTRVAETLRRAIETRVTPNLRGAVWAKLLLNCSVTTIGAVAARTMRQYMTSSTGREVFRKIYDETLSVALASGTRPERMIVEPIPPRDDYDGWILQIIDSYGDVKPSMLQDFERGRRTEIDFINGYVAQLGRRLGVPVPMNAAMTELVHRIEHGEVRPDPARLDDLLAGPLPIST